jgi:hypothetical protein
MSSESKPRPSLPHAFMGAAIGGLVVHCYFYFTDSPKFNSAKLPIFFVMLAVSSWFVWRKRQKAKLGEPYSETF